MSCGGSCSVGLAPPKAGCDACSRPDGAPTSLAFGAATDVGKVRQGNEDSLLVAPPLFAVADGMGGAAGGEVASAIAVDVVRQRSANPSRLLGGIVRDANRAILERARLDPSLRGMGTTLTLLHVDGDVARLAHVGDSRAYLLRQGQLLRLTRDHTIVGELVRLGKLTEQAARAHPHRNMLANVLGGGARAEVEESTLRLEGGDRLLLCTDGVTNMISDAIIRDALARTPDPAAAATVLVAAANHAGGVDNSTAVVVDVPRPDYVGVHRNAAQADARAGAEAADRWLATMSPAERARHEAVNQVFLREAFAGMPRVGTSVGAAATPDLSDAFLVEVVRVAQLLSVSPLDLLLVMNRESGLSPGAANPLGAVGLIQFTNLADVGWTGTREQFLALSGVQQLPYVERFLRRYARYNLNSAGRLHQALFVPATFPGSMQPDLPLVRRGGTRWGGGSCNEACIYEGHEFLDVGNKGYITAGDLETIDRRDAAQPGSPYSRAVARLRVILPQLFPAQALASSASPATPIVLGAALGGLAWLGYRRLSRPAPRRRRG